MKPKICAVLTQNDLQAAKRAAPLADLFEVRIDLTGEGWQSMVAELGKPWIACCRRQEEGGNWTGSEPGRIEKIIEAVKRGASYFDLEISTLKLAQIIPLLKPRAKCILSYHDFKRTAGIEGLRTILNTQIAAGADICKVVTMVKTFEDNLTLVKLVGEFAGKPVVCFGMGTLGISSRILAPLAGAEFTYASIEAGKESAPGQITVSELRSIYEMVNR